MPPKITNSWILYPHRHLEYIMIPLSIISVYGIRSIFLNLNYEPLVILISKLPHLNTKLIIPNKKTRIMKKRQIAYIFVIIILVTTNAVSI